MTKEKILNSNQDISAFSRGKRMNSVNEGKLYDKKLISKENKKIHTSIHSKIHYQHMRIHLEQTVQIHVCLFQKSEAVSSLTSDTT